MRICVHVRDGNRDIGRHRRVSLKWTRGPDESASSRRPRSPQGQTDRYGTSEAGPGGGGIINVERRGRIPRAYRAAWSACRRISGRRVVLAARAGLLRTAESTRRESGGDGERVVG